MNPVLYSLLFALILLFVFLTLAAYTTYAERRIASFIQQRVGPNRVGPWGLLQPAADAVKLLLKEDIVPKHANHFVHFLAPVIAVTLAICGIAMLPFAKDLMFFDANIGVLYVLAVGSIAVYGVTLSGWGSNSKYSLLGGLRASAQMISYELAMGLSVVSVVLLSNHFAAEGSEYLRISTIVEAQKDVWFIFINPIGFLIFMTSVIAEANRAPFDLVEAEQELVGGFHTEYSSMKFGAFYLGEYIHVIVGSGLVAALFLGGYQIPGGAWLGTDSWDPMLLTIVQIGSFFIKMLFLVFVYIWLRWTLPRFKYNQLMNIGWKRFLPISLINLMVLALVLLLLS